jgi:hypothetical protein
MRSTIPELVRAGGELLQAHGAKLALVVGLWLALSAGAGWIKGAWRRFKMRRRFARAARAEDNAAKLLQRRGYKVLEIQPELSWQVKLNGRPHDIEIRADYLVARGRRRYIAEVKTGNHAPSITTSATRRQLLEYRMAYAVEGVLLVDMEDEAIYHVDFSGLEAIGGAERAAFLRGALAGLLFGAAMAWSLISGV